MKALKTSTLIVAALMLLCGTEAMAASTINNLTIGATITNTLKLELNPTSITFPNADPDGVPSIQSTPASVDVDAKAKVGTLVPVTLTVKTGGDLVDGGKSILISNVTWTASGSGFVAGIMSKAADQNVGSWTGPGTKHGALSFFLANSWNYQDGIYTATATFTLSTP